MANRCIYWLSVGFSIAALVVSVAYGLRLHANQDLRRTLDAQQQQINNNQPLVQLYQGLVQNLAGFAVERHDKAVRDLLAKEGIEIPETKATEPQKQEKAKP